MTGLKDEFAAFLLFLIVMLIFVLVLAAFAMFLSLLSYKNQSFANLLCAMFILFFMLFGGFLINQGTLPMVLISLMVVLIVVGFLCRVDQCCAELAAVFVADSLCF